MPAQRAQQLQLTTTGITTFITGAASPGSRCLYDMVFKLSTSTNTAALLKIYLYNGVTRTLLKELYLPAVNTSNTVPGWELHYLNRDLFLATASWVIQVEMTVDVGTIDCTAMVWDL